ncbi:LOW QUALITY PROTEIN: uncharacterized protein LOC135196740 [Macrobrachium nipponense]|uniref:LOW QUALITY PROTEIN: uncharacterized protein LOC135196740 n=1 Tax=Macrobrachium nipponense TaxID=159736 RepID=UPI0030C854EB
MNSVTLCARFQLFILHGWATFFHLQDTEGKTVMMLVGELWVERVRPVIARNWNFQLLKQQLRMYRWYHICFTYDHSAQLITTYIDGKLNNYQAYNVGRPVFGDKATVGQGDNKERSFSGKLSQVNIWDRALDMEEIRSISTCQLDLQGNYISWDTGWVLEKVSSYESPLEDFCHEDKSHSRFWFPQLSFDTAQYLCEALGAMLPRVTVLKDVIALSEEANKTFPDSTACSFEYWTSLSDKEEEGIWRYGNLEKLDNPLWMGQEPNGLHYENCAVLTTQGLADIDCKVDRKCVVCSFSEMPRFSLLGSCETELRNIYFIPYQKHLVKFISWVMALTISEGKMTAGFGWMMSRLTIAIMEKTEPDFPMGRRWWLLKSPVCQQDQGERHRLLLTPCDANEFTCDDGSCIAHHKRCDLKYDCRDNSDEAACVMIDKPTGYQRHLPPRSTEFEDSSLQLTLSVRVGNLFVKTMDMAIDVSFELEVTWKDSRLRYLDLKVNSTLNILPLEVMKTLWTPQVTFVNTIGNQHTHVDEYTTLVITRISDKKQRDEKAPAEVDVYSGTLNSLSIKRKYDLTFTCSLKLKFYPFDFQECSMHFKVTSAPKNFLHFDPVNSSARYFGERHSTEYYVGNLKLKPDESGVYSSMQILVPLRRQSGYAILNIYIPTFVLLIISYITLFIRTDMFDVRMMGALTVQLVIATLFSQVSESLPKTSYFKMVDVWLLFCIGITFLIIIFHAIIDNAIHKRPSKEGGETSASSKVAWKPILSKSKAFCVMGTRDNAGERLVKYSKIIVLISFIFFNIVYWGYTLS